MAEKKKVKKTKEKEEVHELYEIKKNGKEEVVETKGTIKEESPQDIKKQKASENKVLRNIFFFIVFIFLIVVVYFLLLRSESQFKYEGVKYTVIKQGQLTFYQSSFPVTYNKTKAEFNIYLRNDPRKIGKSVPSPEGPIAINNTVLNQTQEFDCDGDQVIAIANVINLYGGLGKKIIKDENASCDVWGRYTYIVIEPGNETRIDKTGNNCYDIKIKDCEVLEGTERFISKVLSGIN